MAVSMALIGSNKLLAFGPLTSVPGGLERHANNATVLGSIPTLATNTNVFLKSLFTLVH
jgi:hypothetical protein